MHTAAAYLALLASANLVWEVAHVRLYTLWEGASPAQIGRAVLHCTLGDVAIGGAALGLALLLVRAAAWPFERFGEVAFAATLIGLLATIAIEWLSVEVWRRWAYAAAMPRVPPFGTGLTPLLQWLILPPLCLWLTRSWSARRSTD